MSIYFQVFIEQLGRIFLCQQRKKRNWGDPTVYEEVGETPKRVGETPKWKTSNHSPVDSMDNLPLHPCNEDLAALLSSLKSLKSKLASIDKAVHGILKCNKSNSGDSVSDIKWEVETGSFGTRQNIYDNVHNYNSYFSFCATTQTELLM